MSVRVVIAFALLAGVASPLPSFAKKKAPPAPAEPQESPEEAEHKAAAKRFFEAGTVLYQRGEFLEAAREFERSFHEIPGPELLYNIASAYDKGGDRKKALEAYKKYIAAMPDKKDAVFARKRAEVLEKEVADEAARATRKVAPALPFAEPVTKHIYQTVITIDGKPYTLLGAGARKVSLFKVYAMGLYVEDEPARAAFPKLAEKAGGSDHDTLVRGDLVNQWLVMQDFGKLARLHFVRAVSAKDTRDAYRDVLPDAFAKTAPPELKAAAEQFLNLFDDVKEGDDVVIRTTADGQVMVDSHGKVKMGPKSPRLVHDIWDIWMGQKPISADLKKTLVDRVDTLGR